LGITKAIHDVVGKLLASWKVLAWKDEYINKWN
jgi:hypothetical protein